MMSFLNFLGWGLFIKVFSQCPGVWMSLGVIVALAKAIFSIGSTVANKSGTYSLQQDKKGKYVSLKKHFYSSKWRGIRWDISYAIVLQMSWVECLLSIFLLLLFWRTVFASIGAGIISFTFLFLLCMNLFWISEAIAKVDHMFKQWLFSNDHKGKRTRRFISEMMKRKIHKHRVG